MRENRRIGRQTAEIKDVYIEASAAIVGEKEGDGPLANCFDIVLPDNEWNEKTWEKTESKMQREATRLAVAKANLNLEDVDRIFSGDLLNQCIGAGFGLRELNIPFLGIYGACSTMIEGLSLAAVMIDGGFAETAVAVTSSHFCTAERQYRNPLEYGGQRTPTAQWTVTGAGAAVLKKGDKNQNVKVTHITNGKIVDMGIKDQNNMGGAMAPAAYDTIKTHLKETGLSPGDYDLIVTGDLGKVGAEVVVDLLNQDVIDISRNYKDCGCMIYDIERQDVHAGGSGCGCVASVLCGHLINEMEKGKIKSMLVVGTGALLSPTSALQGESVPGIAHAVALRRV